jgi:hypothetical protein
MATIRKEIALDVPAPVVWDVVRDFMSIDKRLVPGFVTEAIPDPDTANGVARLVTFFNGLRAREPLVTCDDDARRLVYGATGGRATHYNAAVTVLEAEPGRSKIVWTIDLLPDALAAPVGAMVENAAAVMKATLEGGRR